MAEPNANSSLYALLSDAPSPSPESIARSLRASLDDPKERNRRSREQFERSLNGVAKALHLLDSVPADLEVMRLATARIADAIERDGARSMTVDRLKERVDQAKSLYMDAAASFVVTPELARLVPLVGDRIGQTLHAPIDEDGNRCYHELVEACKRFGQAADLESKARELEKVAIARILFGLSEFQPPPVVTPELVTRLTDDGPCSWAEAAEIVGHKAGAHALEVAVDRAKPGHPYCLLKDPANLVKKGRGLLPTRGTAELVRFKMGRALAAQGKALQRRRAAESKRKSKSSPVDVAALQRVALRRLMEAGSRRDAVED